MTLLAGARRTAAEEGQGLELRLLSAREVLDVDAYTGGFNLQIAWATGYLAGLSAAESEELT